MDFLPHIRIHPVVHVEHTLKFTEQNNEITHNKHYTSIPVVREDGSHESIFDSILSHRRRGKGYWWLTLMKNSLRRDAIWQPTRGFLTKMEL